MTFCQDLELLTTSKTLDNSIDNKKHTKLIIILMVKNFL